MATKTATKTKGVTEDIEIDVNGGRAPLELAKTVAELLDDQKKVKVWTERTGDVGDGKFWVTVVGPTRASVEVECVYATKVAETYIQRFAGNSHIGFSMTKGVVESKSLVGLEPGKDRVGTKMSAEEWKAYCQSSPKTTDPVGDGAYAREMLFRG